MIDISTIHTALLQMVDEVDPAERRRKAGTVATEIVAAFNRAANTTQLALSDTEEVVLRKIDSLNQQIGDNNLLITRFVEAFSPKFDTLLASVQEVTTRQGKLETGQAELATQVSDLGETVNGLSERMETSERDRADLHRSVEAIRAYMRANRRGEIDELRAEIAQLKQAARGGDVG